MGCVLDPDTYPHKAGSGPFLKEIGPVIYNQAVSDAQARMQARIIELDIEVHEEEFTYWDQKKRK